MILRKKPQKKIFTDLSPELPTDQSPQFAQEDTPIMVYDAPKGTASSNRSSVKDENLVLDFAGQDPVLHGELKVRSVYDFKEGQEKLSSIEITRADNATIKSHMEPIERQSYLMKATALITPTKKRDHSGDTKSLKSPSMVVSSSQKLQPKKFTKSNETASARVLAQ